MTARVRSQDGQATLEFAGTALWLVLAAVMAWQMGLIAWAWVSADNAARTAARLYSRTSDTTEAEKDGTQSLSGVLKTGSSVSVDPGSGKATANVNIPVVFPGLKSGVVLSRSAVLPPTG